jgi:hypothetical protein
MCCGGEHVVERGRGWEVNGVSLCPQAHVTSSPSQLQSRAVQGNNSTLLSLLHPPPPRAPRAWLARYVSAARPEPRCGLLRRHPAGRSGCCFPSRNRPSRAPTPGPGLPGWQAGHSPPSERTRGTAGPAGGGKDLALRLLHTPRPMAGTQPPPPILRHRWQASCCNPDPPGAAADGAATPQAALPAALLAAAGRYLVGWVLL